MKEAINIEHWSLEVGSTSKCSLLQSWVHVISADPSEQGWSKRIGFQNNRKSRQVLYVRPVAVLSTSMPNASVYNIRAYVYNASPVFISPMCTFPRHAAWFFGRSGSK